MAGTSVAVRKNGLFTHLRTDNWWLEPMLVVIVFSAFVVYVTWAGLQGNYYWAGIGVKAGDYLCPLYSPLFYIDLRVAGSAPMEHALIPGPWPSWWPTAWLVSSPALFILAFPGLFRFTCYYYRGAYYKAFVMSPPACAVGGKPRKYFGENKYMIFQNLHRYTLYIAILFVFILSYDAYLAFWQTNDAGVSTFGMGVGTLIMLINPMLIGSYTFGCHAMRHLAGGYKDTMTNKGGRTISLAAWNRVTWFNMHHKKFAWASLLWVGFTDIYVRLVSSGVITDLNTWN